MPDDLQGRLERMTVTSRTANRVMLRGETDQAGVRLDYDGMDKVWLLGAFDREAPRRTEKFTGSLGDLWGDLAPSPRRGNPNLDPGGESVKEQRDMTAIREALTAKARKAGVPFGAQGWRKGSAFWSDLLTDSMGRSKTWNAHSLVPGRPLFKELGRNLLAAQAYIAHKDETDAQRGSWHARAAGTADQWMKLRRKDSDASAAFMDLLHEATIAQVDPTKAFQPRNVPANDPEAVARGTSRSRSHAALKKRFDAMPPEFPGDVGQGPVGL